VVDTMRKLPVLMGTGAAILAGLAGYLSGVSGRECVARMVVIMAVFFVLGVFTRNVLKDTLMDVQASLEEKGRKLAEEEANRKRREAEQAREEARQSTIDIRAGDSSPLEGTPFQVGAVTDFIRQELKKD